MVVELVSAIVTAHKDLRQNDLVEFLLTHNLSQALLQVWPSPPATTHMRSSSREMEKSGIQNVPLTQCLAESWRNYRWVLDHMLIISTLAVYGRALGIEKAGTCNAYTTALRNVSQEEILQVPNPTTTPPPYLRSHL